jgi:Protein of unknown function (DUF1602).
LATRVISCMMAVAEAASKPLVGSSKNNTFGFFSKAVAKDNRRCCPPLNREHSVSAQLSRPILFKISWTNRFTTSSLFSSSSSRVVSSSITLGHRRSHGRIELCRKSERFPCGEIVPVHIMLFDQVAIPLEDTIVHGDAVQSDQSICLSIKCVLTQDIDNCCLSSS